MPTQIDSAGITFNDTTSLTSANIGTAQLVNGSVTAAKLGTNEQKQICKAWVNFNGTTSPGTIRSSYNVSSVTKNGTGDYNVNFATAMADANYSVNLTRDLILGVNGGFLGEYGSRSNSSVRFQNCLNVSNFGFDSAYLNVQVFGN
jgi:hypothetical protein